jgi:hypothetical protein
MVSYVFAVTFFYFIFLSDGFFFFFFNLQTTCAQAIKNWETVNNAVAEEADYIKIYCQMPPIAKMDAALIGLKNCE